jgi:riboflavin synthase
MFSGIIDELGRVRERGRTELVVEAQRALDGANIGDSVAVNGCCLTIAKLVSGGFVADVMPETLRRTTLGDLAPGDVVNVEASLRFGERVGGHLVAGHVDAVGVVSGVEDEDNARRVAIDAPETLMQLVAAQGCIAVDGISLTVVEVDAIARSFVVSLIPHTTTITTAGHWRTGSRVNLEADVIARYVRRTLERAGTMPTTRATVSEASRNDRVSAGLAESRAAGRLGEAPARPRVVSAGGHRSRTRARIGGS